MNRYTLSKAGISAREGIARYNGNAAAYEEILKKFPTDPNFAGMCEAIEQRNVQTAFEFAHALKGVVGNLSMNRLFDDLFPLVEELRSGRLEKAAELLGAVKQDYEEAVAAIG